MTIALNLLYYPSLTNFRWAWHSSYNILPLIIIFNGSELFHSLQTFDSSFVSILCNFISTKIVKDVKQATPPRFPPSC